MTIEQKIKKIEGFVEHSTRWQEEGEYTAEVFGLLVLALKIIKALQCDIISIKKQRDDYSAECRKFYVEIENLKNENINLKDENASLKENRKQMQAKFTAVECLDNSLQNIKKDANTYRELYAEQLAVNAALKAQVQRVRDTNWMRQFIIEHSNDSWNTSDKIVKELQSYILGGEGGK